MKIFSKSEERGELVALFDVGSSSVGGALFHLQKSKIPNIVFSIREPIQLEKKFSFDKFLIATLKAVDAIAVKISQAGVGAPKRFFCVLSSPWYGSQTRIIRMTQNTPFSFTAQLADELIAKEVDLFKQEHSGKYASTEGRVLPIELKNIKTILNGYPTSNPLGQKTQELEMTIFISMSSEQLLKKAQEVIIKHFHRENIKFSSFSFVSFAVVRDLFMEEKDFLLIDIGGEVTDISMIKDDVLSTSTSFPKGLNFMIRMIANILNCSLDEARSLIVLYKEQHASEIAGKKLKPFIDKLKIEWLEEFQNALANLSHDISIPSTIFVTVDPDFTNFFLEVIRKEQFSQYTLTESKFKVSFLGTQELHDGVIFEKNVSRDPFITLESIYINRFLR